MQATGFDGDRPAEGEEVTLAHASESYDADSRLQASALGALSHATVLSEFALMLAHELKQPLSAIGAEAGASYNWLSTEPAERSRILTSLRAIGEDVRRASDMVDHLRTLLTPASAVAECEVERLLEELLRRLQPHFATRDLTLATDFAAAGYRVRAEEQVLRQVVHSLLLLAGAACGALPVAQRRIRLSTAIETKARQRLLCLVIDQDGERICDEALGFLELLPPVRATSAGLALCRAILRRHGGRLDVTDKPRRGTTITLALPVSSAPRAPTA